MYVQRTLRRARATIVRVEKQCVTYSECVFLALGVKYAMRMRRIVICGLPRSTIFFSTFSNKWRDFFFKESYRTQNMCFEFLYKFPSEIFLILGRTEIKILFRQKLRAD
jgi:hypothetical protein